VTAKSGLEKTWRNRKNRVQKPTGVLSTIGSTKPKAIKNSENARANALIIVMRRPYATQYPVMDEPSII